MSTAETPCWYACELDDGAFLAVRSTTADGGLGSWIPLNVGERGVVNRCGPFDTEREAQEAIAKRLHEAKGE